MVGIPASAVKLTIAADSLRKLPEGAVYSGKSGQANLTVGSDDSGNIVAEASCDSLQQLVLWYEEEQLEGVGRGHVRTDGGSGVFI